jgi:D-tyrosyl-tRNA(Tyr) deacylase
VRALVQRASRAEVRIDGEAVGRIGPGLCVLVGVTHDDDPAHASRLADKVWNLRIFDDERGSMGVSVADGSRQLLVVSQFTLYGDTRKGRRPSWVDAARPAHAAPLVEHFCDALRELGGEVATGRFGADMEVELVNDGPVALLLEV